MTTRTRGLARAFVTSVVVLAAAVVFAAAPTASGVRAKLVRDIVPAA
jgi:hypothetical protein